MFAIKVDPANEATFEQIADSRNAIKQGIRVAHYQNGRLLVKTIRANINRKDKTGKIRIIRPRGRRRRHQASAPGQTAANITGAYRESIDFQPRGWRTMEFGSRVEHGEFLERGTSKMKSRPGLRIAIDQTEGRRLSTYNKEVRRKIESK